MGFYSRGFTVKVKFTVKITFTVKVTFGIEPKRVDNEPTERPR